MLAEEGLGDDFRKCEQKDDGKQNGVFSRGYVFEDNRQALSCSRVAEEESHEQEVSIMHQRADCLSIEPLEVRARTFDD